MNLDEKFKNFVLSRKSNESIDALPNSHFKGQKADYLLDERTIIAEVKYLTEDRGVTLNDRLNEKANSDPTFPQFFGSVPVEEIINKHKDSDNFRRWVCDYTARTLDQIIRNANHQIRDTKEALGLSNSMGLLVLLNEGVQLYDEDFVYQEVSRILHKQRNGIFERNFVEAVWFINEYRALEKKVSANFFIGPSVRNDHASVILDMLAVDWAAHNGYALQGKGHRFII